MSEASPFRGLLKADSSLREIFPDGAVPLRHPAPRVVQLAGSVLSYRAYLCDLKALSPGQREALARKVAEGRGGDLEAVRAAFERDEEMPMLEKHFDGSSFPLRFAT